MNATRLEIIKIEKQIQALEAEAEALLKREADSCQPNRQIVIPASHAQRLKCLVFKAPPQLH